MLSLLFNINSPEAEMIYKVKTISRIKFSISEDLFKLIFPLIFFIFSQPDFS